MLARSLSTSCGLRGGGTKRIVHRVRPGRSRPTSSRCEQLIHIKIAAALFEIRMILRNASVGSDHFNAIQLLFQQVAKIDSRHSACQKE